MNTSLQRCVRMWQGFSTTSRCALLAVPLIVLFASWAIVAFIMPHPAMLFASALDSEQLSDVDAQLAAWNVPHLTTVDNISVEASARNAILLRLSLAGLPRTHIATTNETLAKASALTPDALLEAQSRTGLAGDVAVALRSIDGVADASVVIAPARQANFTDQEASAASASVRLSLRPGTVLSQEAINGIRAFVSSAVPALSRDHVVLLDDHGVALGADVTSADADEAEHARVALQSAFDAAFGTGATIVRVHAIYRQQALTSHVTERLPVGASALILQRSDEHFKSSEKQYAKSDVTEDRGSVVRDNESSIVAGALDHLSVAVFVDQTCGIDLEKVRSLALAATGISERDYVRVEAVNFMHTVVRRPFESIAWLVNIMPVVAYVAFAGIGIVAVRALRGPLHAFLRELLTRERLRETARSGARIAPSEVHGMLAGEPPHAAAAVISALPTVTATAVLELYESEERAAIITRMTRRPSAFAPTWEQLRAG